MPRFNLLVCAASAVLAFSGTAVQTLTVNVSPSGSDATGDGSAKRPFATLTRARDELRRLKSDDRLSTGATVLLADGEYRLSAPLELDSRDSGSAGFPVRWKAANRGKAVVTGSGGLAWEKIPSSDPVYAIMPEAARAHVVRATIPGGTPLPGFRNVGCFTMTVQRKLAETPLSFFQGDRRLVCARWPDDGWAKMGKVYGEFRPPRPDFPAGVCKEGRFDFDDKARLSRWAKEPDLWAHGLWCFQWADSYERVLGVDAEKGIVHVENVLEEWGFKEGNDFYVLNAFTELDHPGEWAVDRARRCVYVWPLPDVRAQADFASPTNLVSAKRLDNVVFDGLVLEMAYKDAAVFKDATNVAFEATVIRHTGEWGVRFEGGGFCRMDGCDVYDIGEGGIYMEGGDGDNLVPAEHKTVNCHIHHYGRVIPNRPGISLNGVGCRAERNLVHHSDSQGLQFKGNDHYVGYNVFHDLCQHNDDAGSIYGYMCDFTQRGTVIEYNVVHMSGNQPRAHHVDAIYLDAWTSGVTVRGNILNRAPKGVWSSGGQDNKIVKNLIMNCEVPVARGNCGRGSNLGMRVWTKGRQSFMMQKLIKNRARYEKPPWSEKYPRLLAPLDIEDAQFAHAALWATISNNVAIGCGHAVCREWPATKPYTAIGDNLTFDGDPFVDYYNFDWRLKPDSSLREFLGADYRFSEMGLFASPTRVSPPVKFSPDATRPRPLSGEFEDPMVCIHVIFDGPLPAGVTEMAENMENCTLPDWGHGKRVLTRFGVASTNGWKEYSFSFTPKCDGRVSVALSGGMGEMTLYDDIRAEGMQIADMDFSSDRRFWRYAKDGGMDPIFFGGVKRKHGLFERLPSTQRKSDFLPLVGRRFASASHGLRVQQAGVAIKKGEKVTLSFKARAYLP